MQCALRGLGSLHILSWLAGGWSRTTGGITRLCEIWLLSVDSHRQCIWWWGRKKEGVTNIFTQFICLFCFENKEVMVQFYWKTSSLSLHQPLVEVNEAIKTWSVLIFQHKRKNCLITSSYLVKLPPYLLLPGKTASLPLLTWQNCLPTSYYLVKLPPYLLLPGKTATLPFLSW